MWLFVSSILWNTLGKSNYVVQKCEHPNMYISIKALHSLPLWFFVVHQIWSSQISEFPIFSMNQAECLFVLTNLFSRVKLVEICRGKKSKMKIFLLNCINCMNNGEVILKPKHEIFDPCGWKVTIYKKKKKDSISLIHWILKLPMSLKSERRFIEGGYWSQNIEIRRKFNDRP